MENFILEYYKPLQQQGSLKLINSVLQVYLIVNIVNLYIENVVKP